MRIILLTVTMHRNQASVVCFILMKRDEIINSMGIIRMKQKKNQSVYSPLPQHDADNLIGLFICLIAREHVCVS